MVDNKLKIVYHVCLVNGKHSNIACFPMLGNKKLTIHDYDCEHVLIDNDMITVINDIPYFYSADYAKLFEKYLT